MGKKHKHSLTRRPNNVVRELRTPKYRQRVERDRTKYHRPAEKEQNHADEQRPGAIHPDP